MNHYIHSKGNLASFSLKEEIETTVRIIIPTAHSESDKVIKLSPLIIFFLCFYSSPQFWWVKEVEGLRVCYPDMDGADLEVCEHEGRQYTLVHGLACPQVFGLEVQQAMVMLFFPPEIVQN